MDLGARAGIRTVVSACASSTEAIANGYDHLQQGLADVVVAGGSEAAIHPLPLAAFANMQRMVLERAYALPFGSLTKVQAVRSNVQGFVPFRIPRFSNVWVQR